MANLIICTAFYSSTFNNGGKSKIARTSQATTFQGLKMSDTIKTDSSMKEPMVFRTTNRRKVLKWNRNRRQQAKLFQICTDIRLKWRSLIKWNWTLTRAQMVMVTKD